jgi:hypothetical protein
MSNGDVLAGAAKGAAAGTAVLPGIGTAVGAIVGAIGGIFKSKSRKAARKANDTKQRMDAIQNATIRRNQLREAFIMRQTALAAGAAETGGTQSSTVLGGLGAIGSQFGYNERYFDTQQANINLFNKYSKKSEKFADYAGAVDQIGEAALIVSRYRGGMTPAKSPVPTTGSGSGPGGWGMNFGVMGDPSLR